MVVNVFEELSSDGDDIPSDRRQRSPAVKQFLSEISEDKYTRLKDTKEEGTKDFNQSNLDRFGKEKGSKIHQKLTKKNEETLHSARRQDHTFGYEQLKMQSPLKESDLGSSRLSSDFSETTLRKKPKSFFKNLVRRNSPKLKGLGQTLKRSWSNLYESKLSTMENKESSGTAGLLEGGSGGLESAGGPTAYLNTKLQELGVDPNWDGIPDDSLTRAMATLKHQETVKAKVISRNTLLESF